MVAVGIMLSIITFAISYGSWDPFWTLVNGYRICVTIIAVICILGIWWEYKQKMTEIEEIFKNSP